MTLLFSLAKNLSVLVGERLTRRTNLLLDYSYQNEKNGSLPNCLSTKTIADSGDTCV